MFRLTCGPLASCRFVRCADSGKSFGACVVLHCPVLSSWPRFSATEPTHCSSRAKPATYESALFLEWSAHRPLAISPRSPHRPLEQVARISLLSLLIPHRDDPSHSRGDDSPMSDTNALLCVQLAVSPLVSSPTTPVSAPIRKAGTTPFSTHTCRTYRRFLRVNSCLRGHPTLRFRPPPVGTPPATRAPVLSAPHHGHWPRCTRAPVAPAYQAPPPTCSPTVEPAPSPCYGPARAGLVVRAPPV